METNCAKCNAPLTAWDRTISKALVFKLPRCTKCMAEEYDMNVEDFNAQMEWFRGKRPCLFQ